MAVAPLYEPEPSPDAPTFDDLALADLAVVLDAGGNLGGTPGRLARLLRAGPHFAPQLAGLETLAADAGLEQDLEIALLHHRRFERLLAAGSWKDPGEVLGVEDPEALCYPDLVRIADARAARADDPSAILEVKERLLAAEVRALEEPLQQFVLRLAPVSPEAASRILELAGQLLEYSHEASGP